MREHERQKTPLDPFLGESRILKTIIAFLAEREMEIVFNGEETPLSLNGKTIRVDGEIALRFSEEES